MQYLTLKIRSVGGQIPKWKDTTNAGLDLHSSVDLTIFNHSSAVVPLGICTEFSDTFVAIIKDRSGHASRGRYTHAGVIDSSYRGEWKVIFENRANDDWIIKKGDRIAQVVFVPCFHLVIGEVDSLQDSTRMASGFGASGD